MAAPLLQFTGKSIYCPKADVHIDPSVPVKRALITHGHSDHARWGSLYYLAHRDSEAILRHRLGQDIRLQTVQYGEEIVINGVRFSFYPAGHILGSSQICVSDGGERWVVSGDYKLEDDGFAAPFEPVRCNVFITESTFGLPVYRWKPQEEIISDILAWIGRNRGEGKCTVLMGYSLGKMQRLLTGLSSLAETGFYAHGAVFSLNETLRKAGYHLPELTLITRDTDLKALRGSVVFAPPSAADTPWIRKLAPFATGYCSGWMAVRGAKNRRAVDRGFALSDHADWTGLNRAIALTGAERVFVTHGYTSVFSRWLQEKGYEASEVRTLYGAEEEGEASVNEDQSST